MAKFLIAGTIVDTDADRMTFEDVTPSQISSFIEGLGDGEDLDLEITSYGGSVPAGLAICNMLKMASIEGHKTSAHVIGVVASMASGIACACDVLKIDSNAFLMVHNPFTFSMGDADDLRKDADTLDKMRDALLAIYRTKFVGLSDDAIKKMMDDETWILGRDAETYKLNAEIIETEEPLKAAAFAGKALPKFLHVPQTITDLVAAKVEAKTEEPKTEDKPAEPTAEAKAEPKAEAEMVTKAEADKRVSGMQSAMAKQIDSLKKDYEARITDFENQLKVKSEELTRAQADVTRLTDDLKNTSDELLKMTSAFEEKSNTLAKLNAGVLTPNEELPTMKAGLAKCTTAAERVAFLKSGKYIK